MLLSKIVMKNKGYQFIDFPNSRIGTFDVGVLGSRKHHIAALVEIDVTEAREKIRAERLNKRISFTAWILKAIAETMVLHKEVGGYLWKNKKKVVFDDVSIVITVEKNIAGVKVPLPLLIENINRKSPEEITEIIDSAKNSSVKNENDTVMSSKTSRLQMKLYYMLPRIIRQKLVGKIVNNPFLAKNMMGNAIYTSTGMAGNISGWVIPKSYHNLCFAVGSIAKKPHVVNDEIKIREIMHMTVLMNHDIVDGIPMAKFIADLVKKIELF